MISIAVVLTSSTDCAWLFLAMVMISAVALPCYTADEEVVYVEPPLDFDQAPLNLVLGAIFAKVNRQYIEEEDMSVQKVTIHFTKRMTLDDALNAILGPKNITWRFDERRGVYIIGKKAPH